MKRRVVSWICILIMLLGTVGIANANSFSMNITDAASYKAQKLSGNVLRFDAGIDCVVNISGEALTSFHYDSDIKYYEFTGSTVTVRIDKNGVYTHDIGSAVFELTDGGISVKLIKTNGAQEVVQSTPTKNRYTVIGNKITDYTLAWFGSEHVTALSVKAGKLVFETDKLTRFELKEFMFSDVSNKADWFYPYVTGAAVHGVLSGVGNNLFKPQKNVTRAELAAMIVKATQDVISYPDSSDIKYSDVGADMWYNIYIQKVSELGIMTGVDKTTFKPEATATREQVAAVTERIIKILGSYGGNDLPVIDKDKTEKNLADMYTDAAKIQPWACPSVEFCAKLNIMVGHNKLFRPSGNITRAECAKIFYSVFENMY